MARKQSKRKQSKLVLASLRKAMLSEPDGLEKWRPRTRVVQNKKRLEARSACRGKVDY